MSLTQEQVIKKSASIMGITVEEYKARAANSEKRCVGCREWKPRTEFPLDNSRKDGLGIRCKVCRSDTARMKRRQAREIREATPKPPKTKKKRPSRSKAKPIVADVVQLDEAVEVKPTRAERVAKVAGVVAEFKAYIKWRKEAANLTDLSFIGDD